MDKVIAFVKDSLKSIVAGGTAFITTFQGGATLQVSIIAGVIALLAVWIVPNIETPTV